MNIEPIVHGLVSGLVGGGEGIRAQTTAVLVRKVVAMPRFTSFGMTVLLVVFDWYGVLRSGRRFRSMGHASRDARISEWMGAPIGPCRDMIEFVRKMGTFVRYSLEAEE
jgi:hypothetical protein